MNDVSAELKVGQGTIGSAIRVLPETINQAIDTEVRQDHFARNITDELKSYNWQAYEIDRTGNPRVNVFFTDHEHRNDTLTTNIIERIHQLQDILGYSVDELRELRVFLDPSAKSYKENALAIYNFVTGELWVKSSRGAIGIDHELGHWITLSVLRRPRNISSLLSEGVATWLAWYVKNGDERARNPADDYNEKIDFWTQSHVFTRDNLTLDAPYHNVPAMSLGAKLFDVIYEMYGSDTRKMAEAWRTVDRFPTVSLWLDSLGFSPADIEKRWQDKVFGKH